MACPSLGLRKRLVIGLSLVKLRYCLTAVTGHNLLVWPSGLVRVCISLVSDFPLCSMFARNEGCGLRIKEFLSEILQYSGSLAQVWSSLILHPVAKRRRKAVLLMESDSEEEGEDSRRVRTLSRLHNGFGAG